MSELSSSLRDRNRALLLQAHCGCAEREEEALEILVRENSGLVRSIARRFVGRGTDEEDLFQIGMIGMVKAIRSFDSARGTAFSTYAVPLIVGEIRKHLRDDGLVRVGRGYKKLGAELLRLRSRILQEEGREPGITELSAALGVSAEEAAQALDASMPISSFSDPIAGSDGEDGGTLGGRIPDESSAEELLRLEDQIALGQAIARLPPLHRKIVLLRYYRGCTQQETATRLGLNQVKISREEKKLLASLRKELIGE
jgi:RNA polymerase sporulation-specific sigma factor